MNPRKRVRSIVAEPLVVHHKYKGIEIEQRVKDIIGQVGLGEQALDLYPHEFSGGSDNVSP